MPLDLKKRFWAYIGPCQPLMFGYYYLLRNLMGGPHDILNRTFATWYSTLGHMCAAFEEANTSVPRLVGQASGTVLELGPGPGLQLPRYDRNKVSRIYGIEPNDYLFNLLRDETIGKYGLADIYVPIHGVLEDDKLLESHGIEPGSVDTVVCMQVLCSVEDPSKAARQIHRLLKPGGQLLFWEHQVSRDRVTRVVQAFWNLFWSPVIGGCRLDRDIETAISTAGDWNVAEMGYEFDGAWVVRPHVLGRFIKQ